MELINMYKQSWELKECNVFVFGNSNQQNNIKFPNTFDEETYLLQKSRTYNNFYTITEATKLECLKWAYSFS
jgi:hypothetical protein